MASLTQQPQLTPQPNLEPPGFNILRDLLMRKLIGEEAAPYGFTGSPQQAQGLFTGQGRGMFNPYQGGYGQQAQTGGGPTPGSMQLPGGGVYGQEPANSMQTIMGLLQGGGQGGGGGTQAPPPQAQMMPKQGGGGMYGFDGPELLRWLVPRQHRARCGRWRVIPISQATRSTPPHSERSSWR
jgi:hypothetical protein